MCYNIDTVKETADTERCRKDKVMKDVKEFLESKYTVNALDNAELCECIEDAPDWEVCEMYGLLDELADRADMDFDYDSDHWESDIDKAIEKLRSTEK